MKDFDARFAALKEQFENNQATFVLTELETSTAFCERALASSDADTVERNKRNACKGYETALKFWNNSELDLGDIPEFRDKLDHLKSLLHQLGQNV